ncbi:MAG TPA: tetratricopeptide repeat protein [Candidatus Dormibacteraeota bacterium]|nr:tetratricopeptide repeat protein [Candidatus Dormibacteraeota bacterium]
MKYGIRVCILLLLTTGSAARAATPEECHTLRKHGRREQAARCYLALTRTNDAYLRAEGDWGLERYPEANNEFRAAVKQADGNAMYRVRWGRLLRERFNNADGEELFREALERDPRNAQALLGLALVSADRFDDQAVVYAMKSLAIDPKLVEAHELMAKLALENSAPNAAVAQANEALKLAPDALDAMATHAAVELLVDRSPDAWLAKMLSVNSTYGRGYAEVAHHLVLNRRYDDGVAYYRKAIELDPQLCTARTQLGISLMRMGQEDEPRRQLEVCYANGYRDAATVNSLRLLDSYKKFVTFKDDTVILKLHKNEAELLRPYFERVLKRAMTTYENKYKVKLADPVQVEVYPDHEDFAVRTLGMPGLGALGVTFGTVIAMDSPSGRKPGDFHWASTLWHEMSHVYILAATNHRVPRWFTEGLAVHEETEASPEWGDRMTPEILVAIRDKKLLPVAELDRGFVRPSYATQVIVSYYQAGRICDYIKGRWGDDKLLDMVHAFAEKKTTTEAIQGTMGMPPEEFDKEFLAWLDKDIGKTAASFDEWRRNLKSLAEMAKEKKFDEVVKEGEKVRGLYPDYVYNANAYEFVAQANLAQGNKRAAAAALADYQRHGGHDPGTLTELASLEAELGENSEAAATLDRINYIYPMTEELHRKLGNLWFGLGDYPGAIREYGAAVAMHPLDKASAQFNLARAYYATGQIERAKETVLLALEAAPGFRPAQELLLQIEDAKKGKS